MIEDSSYLLIAGDHNFMAPFDPKTKSPQKNPKTRESFLSLHEISKGFPLLQTFKFEKVSRSIVSLNTDQESGIIIASDMIGEALFLR